MDQVIDAALQKGQVRELEGDRNAIRQAIKSAVADVFKQRGFMSHGIERKDIEGYDTKDPWQDFIEYISGYSGFLTKMRSAPEFTRALSEIPAQDKENLYQYATKYVRDVMQIADAFDQAVDKARGIMFHWYLGDSIKSAALQLTQNWIAGSASAETIHWLSRRQDSQGNGQGCRADCAGHWQFCPQTGSGSGLAENADSK